MLVCIKLFAENEPLDLMNENIPSIWAYRKGNGNGNNTKNLLFALTKKDLVASVKLYEKQVGGKPVIGNWRYAFSCENAPFSNRYDYYKEIYDRLVSRLQK